MASLQVRRGLGPTLPELLAPRWRAASRGRRAAAVALAVGVLAVLAGGALTLLNSRYSHGGRAPFSFSYRGLWRVPAAPGEYVRLQSPRHGTPHQLFAVRPLVLPPYQGSQTAALPLYVGNYLQTLPRLYANYSFFAEGKIRINGQNAYQVQYYLTVGGRRQFGRDVLFLPQRAGAREGAIAVLHTVPTAKVKDPTTVGSFGALSVALHNFTIG
jgi:hypothetical protein